MYGRAWGFRLITEVTAELCSYTLNDVTQFGDGRARRARRCVGPAALQQSLQVKLKSAGAAVLIETSIKLCFQLFCHRFVK